MTTETDLADRDIRQRDLVPPSRLATSHAIVIGVGAVGRQAALQLAAIGVPSMTLYDPDTVRVENLAVQGFWESDLGELKVQAVVNVCQRQFPSQNLEVHAERFRRSHARSWSSQRELAVFACVDAIESRRVIWESVKDRVQFFCDGRLTAEVIRILASVQPHDRSHYGESLFGTHEAYVGRCTAKSTIYSANIAAGLMLAQFARWLRGQPVVADQTLNLLAAELTVSD